MSTSTDLRAVALRLAVAHPEAPLPCPECAASVKASNLERHLAKVHPGQATAAARWAGADHAILLPLLLVGATSAAAFFLCALVAPAVADVALFGWIPLLLALLVLAGLASFGRLPATLGVEGDDLVLRYAFGLMRRRVRLPPRTIEVGGLLERRESPSSPTTMANPPTHDVRVGTYVRLEGAGGSLTVGSKTGTGLTKHWGPEGWSRGGARRRWDVTLPPSALVAVEYLLAAHGSLTVRAPQRR